MNLFFHFSLIYNSFVITYQKKKRVILKLFMRLFNSKGQTLVTVPPSSESLFPNKLFFLSALDLGKYATIAEINEMVDIFNADLFLKKKS